MSESEIRDLKRFSRVSLRSPGLPQRSYNNCERTASAPSRSSGRKRPISS